MFDSIKSLFGRANEQEADRRALEDEGKQFKLPSEWFPQVCKYLFFAGLGFLNYRLFAHAVPGAWGVATGIMAMMAEAIGLYATHYFSRSSGAFRWALGISGAVLMVFSIVHATFSILDLIGVAGITKTVRWYSHVVAFPLLAGLVGFAVVALTMTHPKNLIRLRQARSHTRVAIGRAEAASELELNRAEKVVEFARLDRVKERRRNEAEYLGEVKGLIELEQKKREMIARIPDRELREKLARELGIELPRTELQRPPEYSDGYQSGRSDLD